MAVLSLSHHAVDNASNRVRGIWHNTKLKCGHGYSNSEDEGLFSWLMRITIDALEKGEKLPSGKIRYLGMKFYVDSDDHNFPVLMSVERVSGNDGA